MDLHNFQFCNTNLIRRNKNVDNVVNCFNLVSPNQDSVVKGHHNFDDKIHMIYLLDIDMSSVSREFLKLH